MTKMEQNKKLQTEYAQIKQEMKAKLAAIKTQVQPPCSDCHCDGEFRCQACEKNFFEGFNIREYPGPQSQFD